MLHKHVADVWASVGDVRARLHGFSKQMLRTFTCTKGGWVHLVWRHVAKQIHPDSTSVGSILQVSACSTSHSPIHPVCLWLTSYPPLPHHLDPLGLYLQHLTCRGWEDFSRASLLPPSAAICNWPVASCSSSGFLQVSFWGLGPGKQGSPCWQLYRASISS